MTAWVRARAPGDQLLPSGDSLDGVVSAVTSRCAALLTRALSEVVPGAGDLIPQLTGGKLLRTRLTQLIAHSLGSPDQASVTRACVAIELVHTASLVHDDIIDGSLTRRGWPTVHRSTSPDTAILIGDLLISTAFEEVAPLGSSAVTAVAHAFTQLCRGQLAESDLSWDADAQAAIEHYARRKTGGLFGASVELGALASGETAARASELRESGELLGVAFQLADDLIDVQADLTELDKDHGADLRNGIPTLPIWHAYHALRSSGVSDDAADWGERLARAAGSSAAREFTLARISELVDESLGFAEHARYPELVDSAVSLVLGALPEYSPREAEGSVR